MLGINVQSENDLHLEGRFKNVWSLWEFYKMEEKEHTY